MSGRQLPLSPPRRLATEFCCGARRSPRAALSGSLQLCALAMARPPWSSILARAYAPAAAGLPALRRVFVHLPWPHPYELPASTACLVVERDWRDEKALPFCRIEDPAALPLAEVAPASARPGPHRAEACATGAAPAASRRCPGRCGGCCSGSGSISADRCRTGTAPSGSRCWGRRAWRSPRSWRPRRASLGKLPESRRGRRGGAAGSAAMRALEAALHGPPLAELRALAPRAVA